MEWPSQLAHGTVCWKSGTSQIQNRYYYKNMNILQPQKQATHWTDEHTNTHTHKLKHKHKHYIYICLTHYIYITEYISTTIWCIYNNYHYLHTHTHTHSHERAHTYTRTSGVGILNQEAARLNIETIVRDITKSADDTSLIQAAHTQPHTHTHRYTKTQKYTHTHTHTERCILIDNETIWPYLCAR